MLENNSNEMKTIVETFLIEETAELIYDNEKLDKWNKYVDELGLTGQKQIVKPNKSPIPFMHLKKSYISICEILCPRKVVVEEYNITPIPVEILDLVALSKKENYFEQIQIWYDDKSPDPFAIGLNYVYYSTNNNTWKTRHSSKELAQKEMDEKGWEGSPARTCDFEAYLIGKWADVKRSFEELKGMAIKRFKESKSVDLNQKIRDAQRELEDLDNEAYNLFN